LQRLEHLSLYDNPFEANPTISNVLKRRFGERVTFDDSIRIDA
jgi:hypothetical protein